jgi:hypothetical protein
MSTGTHDKAQYISVHGRVALFMKRPQKTRQKRYRQPVVHDKKYIHSYAQLEQWKREWEDGILV